MREVLKLIIDEFLKLKFCNFTYEKLNINCFTLQFGRQHPFD